MHHLIIFKVGDLQSRDAGWRCGDSPLGGFGLRESDARCSFGNHVEYVLVESD